MRGSSLRLTSPSKKPRFRPGLVAGLARYHSRPFCFASSRNHPSRHSREQDSTARPRMKHLTHPLTIATLLAFNGGVVDTAGFLGLHGLFVAHVTGNFVTKGAAIVGGGLGFIGKQ